LQVIGELAYEADSGDNCGADLRTPEKEERTNSQATTGSLPYAYDLAQMIRLAPCTQPGL